MLHCMWLFVNLITHIHPKVASFPKNLPGYKAWFLGETSLKAQAVLSRDSPQWTVVVKEQLAE